MNIESIFYFHIPIFWNIYQAGQDNSLGSILHWLGPKFKDKNDALYLKSLPSFAVYSSSAHEVWKVSFFYKNYKVDLRIAGCQVSYFFLFSEKFLFFPIFQQFFLTFILFFLKS